MKKHYTNPALAPQGFTGFGPGHYAQTAAWPEDMRADHDSVGVLNDLGYFGPGMWADAWGGLLAAGCLDAEM